MKKSVSWFCCLIIGLAACNKLENVDGEISYQFHVDKEGDKIKEGDYVALSMIEKTEEDSIIYNSYEQERHVLLLREKPLFKGDFYTALGLLSEGDSATFKINKDSIFKTDNSKKNIHTNSKYLVYTVKINKVIQLENLNDRAFSNKIEAFHKEEMEDAKKSEAAKIRAYIASHNLKPAITKSGLNYLIIKPGTGPKALPKDTVLVNYTGKLLSGKIFDTSDSVLAKKNNIYNRSANYGPVKLAVVNSPVSGFQEALGLFSMGTKVKLIIPSKLAYGNQGNHLVQPYTPLLCEMEILSIKHP